MGHVAAISESHSAVTRIAPVRQSAARAIPGTARLIPGSERHAFAGGRSEARWFARQGRLPAKAVAGVFPAFVTRISPSHLGGLLMDLFLLALILFVQKPLTGAALSPGVTVVSMGIFLALALQEGLYAQEQEGVSVQLRIAKATAWTVLFTILLAAHAVRGMAAAALLGVTIFCVLSAWRWIWGKVDQAGSRPSHNVLVVGEAGGIYRIAAAVRRDPHSARRIKAMLPAWRGFNLGAAHISRLTREHHIDEIVVAGSDPHLVESLRTHCSENALDFTVAPLTSGRILQVENLAGTTLITVRAPGVPVWGLAVKRIVDVLGAALGGILILPLMSLIAALVKLDSAGPVLYPSTRVGHKGQPFTCYKFRTMFLQADREREKLRKRNERQGPFFKLHNDPRVTQVGRWLRRYSLDELPQLWNVLRGEMSLVGPRPHPTDDVERYQVEDLQRLDFVPGMTGLWQVAARNDPSFERCVALDVDYIHRWSLLLDLRILGRTVLAVLHGSGS